MSVTKEKPAASKKQAWCWEEVITGSDQTAYVSKSLNVRQLKKPVLLER